MIRPARTVVATVLPLLVAGCMSEPAPTVGGHSHAGGAMVSLPVGDGTESYEVGYTLSDVRLPERAGRAGEVGFEITADDEPQTDFLVEQTRKLHLYVVRDDLEVFRHLHPTMTDDGAWTAPVTLPSGGTYRVIAEFVAEDEGGNGDHVVLGAEGTVAGGPAEAGDEVDPTIRVSVTDPPAVSDDGRLRLRVRDARDRPVLLGSYLGTWAHVTGFHEDTGAVVHMHPFAEPEVTEDGSGLTFHSDLEQAGDYTLFVQVRVDGFLHTVPVGMTVT